MGLDNSAKVLVYGMAATGHAAAQALVARGHTVVLADDSDQTPQTAALDGIGTIKTAPTETELRELVASVDVVSPSPGIPAHHGVYRLAQELNRPIIGDFDLAAQWDSRPMAAITGTNGKTTVTLLVGAMLVRSGIAAVVAGNVEVPLVASIDTHAGAEMFVIEASSFQLASVQTFAPSVGAWLNLAPDHLDWHGDFASYENAKARIWANADSPVAIYPHADKQIAKHIPPGSKLITFCPADNLTAGDVSLDTAAATSAAANLCALGRVIISVADMARRQPHDISNAAAATAVALEMGATDSAIAAELAEFEGLPHRLKQVATVGGVAFYDDSKATTPQAVIAGLSGFQNAVLIAGGRNKGVSLEPLGALADRLLAVVAIGEASQEMADIFEGRCRFEKASSMREAVATAHALAAELLVDACAATVVLSPGCASFDWYRNYEERGDDFVAEVLRLAQSTPAQNTPAQGGAKADA